MTNAMTITAESINHLSVGCLNENLVTGLNFATLKPKRRKLI